MQQKQILLKGLLPKGTIGFIYAFVQPSLQFIHAILLLNILGSGGYSLALVLYYLIAFNIM
jgi:hypothetical protein